MDIISIKCTMDKAHLLKEFFSQLASPANYKKQIGFFIPTGAAHTLGPQNYAKLISKITRLSPQLSQSLLVIFNMQNLISCSAWI